MSIRRILTFVALSLVLSILVAYAIASGTVLAVTRTHGFFAMTGLIALALAICDFAVLAVRAPRDLFVRRALAMVGITAALYGAGNFCYALLPASHAQMALSWLALALEVASACAFQYTVIWIIWTAVKRSARV